MKHGPNLDEHQYQLFCASIAIKPLLLRELFAFCYSETYFNPNLFLVWYNSASLQDKQRWLQHFSPDEKAAIFAQVGKKSKDSLYERYLKVPEEQKRYQFMGVFAFCFPEGVFDAKIFLLWQNYAHPCDKGRWFSELSLTEKQAVQKEQALSEILSSPYTSLAWGSVGGDSAQLQVDASEAALIATHQRTDSKDEGGAFRRNAYNK